MSSENSDQFDEQLEDTTGSENTEFQQLSAKDKILNFINTYPKQLLIVLGVILVIFVVWLFVYFGYFYQSKMEKFADEFCACAESSQGEYYNYSKDGFGFKSDLSSCFAEDFMLYGEQFNKKEKKVLLVEFQEEVLKKCPQKLADIFEYK